MKKIALTGDRPTGKLHLGHYVGSLANRIKLQHEYDQYIMIADMQALTDNSDRTEKVRNSIIEVALDYLSVGLLPENNTFFVQSQIPELSELTMYFMNIVNVSRLERNPTVKNEMKQKWFWRNVPVGFFTYPISQAADITAFRAEYIPVGEDQLPMIEQTNEIVRKFNTLYKSDALIKCKPILSTITRLPGTDWKEKMGKSLGNAIYLSDSPEEISRKVKDMFTDPNHLRVEDPGNTEWNPVFTYLDAFDPDKEWLEFLKSRYRLGGIGDGIIKQRLENILLEFLEPIRKKREMYTKDPGEIFRMLDRWSQRARITAAHTLHDVKCSMGMYTPL
jgi:tryptophanyl-tRNA synthetase